MKTEPFRTRSVAITVDDGYDIHSIGFSMRTLGRILAGRPVSLKGQGYACEGEVVQDFWSFNDAEPGDLSVDCEDGRDVYKGNFITDPDLWFDLVVCQADGMPLPLAPGAEVPADEPGRLGEAWRAHLRTLPLWRRMVAGLGEDADKVLGRLDITPCVVRGDGAGR